MSPNDFIQRLVDRPRALRLLLSVLISAPFLLTLRRWPVGWDAQGFVLSAQGINLALNRPHPPGYPLYAWFAAGLQAVGVSKVSTIMLSFGVLNVAALALLVHAALQGAALMKERFLSLRESVLVAGLLFLIPGWSQLAVQSLPDLCAIALLAQAVVALGQRRVLLSGVLLGISLANRPSDLLSVLAIAPLVAWLFALNWRAIVTLVATTGTAALLSLASMLAWHTPSALFGFYVIHGRGHFSGLFAQSVQAGASTTAQSLARFFQGPSLGSALLLLLVWFGITSIRSVKHRTVSMVICVFAIFIRSYTQSLAHSRHDALFALILMVFAVRGFFSGQVAWLRPAVLVGTFFVGSLSYGSQLWGLRSTRELVPPDVAVAERARREGATMLFGLRAARAAELLGMTHFIARNPGEMLSTAERLDVLPTHLYFTDELEHTERIMENVHLVDRFCVMTNAFWTSDESNRKCVTLFSYRVRQ